MLISYIHQWLRINKYKLLSTCKNVFGKPILNQPCLFNGKGKIIFHENVKIGVINSPYLYSNYAYIESRKPDTVVEIESGVYVNNNFVIIAAGEGVYIGKNTIAGTNFEIYDSDFHDLHPDKRMQGGTPKTAKVVIEENVFFGSNVTVLKGVTIGKNSVIANGSIVTKSIPENAIAAGNPAKVIKTLPF